MRAACILLSACAVTSLAAEPAAPDTRVLEAWLKRQPSIRTLEARFTQERKLPALKQPVVAQGRIAFERPGKLRWELGEPAATVAVSDGSTLTLIEVGPKLARRMDAASPQARQFTLLASEAFQDAPSFHQNFEVLGHQVSDQLHHYTLRPVDRRLRSKLPGLLLTIDPQRNQLREIELELPDRSRIRSVFREIRINPKLEPSRFQFSLDGYRVAR
jgi:outer membrane lipoprotein-sorting protein